MRRWMVLILIFSLLLSGCEEEGSGFFIDSSDVCSQQGNYCHLVRQDGGTAYINFSDVNGNITYRVNA